MTKILIALTLALSLTACGGGLSGKYRDKNSTIELEFQSGGKMIINAMGIKQEASYEKDGNNLKLIMSNGQNQILTINENGCIKWPFLGNVCKIE